MHRFPVFALVATLTLTADLAGCTNAVDSVDESSAPILDGSVDSTDSAVVGVLRVEEDSGSGCSGTLIAQNLVLTARHCVVVTSLERDGVDCAVARLGPSIDASSLFVSTLTPLTRDVREYHQAAAVFVAPGGDLLCGQDLALISLREPIPTSEATPLSPFVDGAIEPGQEYAAVGYGRTGPRESGTFGTRRRLDGLQVRCVGTACASVHVAGNEWLGSAGVCQGDSGGPALDQLGRILGVGSRSTVECAASVYESVPAFSEWLIDTARAVTQEADLPTPSWAAQTPPAAQPPAAEDDDGGCSVARASGPSGTVLAMAIGLALVVMRCARRLRRCQSNRTRGQPCSSHSAIQ
jgi:hypothetical protein